MHPRLIKFAGRAALLIGIVVALGALWLLAGCDTALCGWTAWGIEVGLAALVILGAVRLIRRLRRSSRGRRFLTASCGMAIFTAGVWAGASGIIAGPPRAEDFSLVRSAWDELFSNYVRADDVDSRQLAYDAIDTLAEGMGDTGHTTFLTPDQAAAFHAYEERSGAAANVGRVEWAMVPGTAVAFIHVPDFYVGSAADMSVAIKRALAAGANAWVVDLRGNPGGLLHEAVDAVSLFLADGDVIRMRDAYGNEEAVPVTEDPLVPDYELAVLVNGDSASAAEIFAAAMQDARRATVVGTRTRGTGTVLGEYPLGDGSELWIGDVLWLTPSGRSVWHVGLRPDITVPLPAGVRPMDADDIADASGEEIANASDDQLLQSLRVVDP